jgi:transcription antitermination factor NusG
MSEAFCDWLAFLRSIDLPWCVVIARPGRENAVQVELAMAGWSTYLPMQTVWMGKGPRRRRAKQPLFARYLFAVCNPGGDVAAPRSIDGLAAIRRCADGQRSAVRIDLLGRLMLTEARHGLDLTYSKPKAAKRAFVCGQPVTVRAGVLRGFDALILKVLSEREVVASVSFSSGVVGEATFRAGDLEAIDEAA